MTQNSAPVINARPDYRVETIGPLSETRAKTFLDRGVIGNFSAMARAFYQERRWRDRYFDHALFAEPGWDMLLDLRFHVDGPRHLSSSSACIGAAAPASTGLRHLLALERCGLVERLADPSDARRKLTRMTIRGVRLMDAYLAEVAISRMST
ncbi:hypothetical protein ACFO8O_15685 [Hephaestia sp. GCM10023244]|uniref:MarR family winged helix-turn-helix transcriptional regulator n=1 Tax=unclassified Hephaestia TaxID=2631281 RepID=UPI0020770390|nr:MarR family winged helix-turn-helix transcriptional regulator [Hephaestia sp. MAHUQ-44]MCM8732405.1 MarR family winged helix-turn-helix transcriptional regulator [Hephaestia sp. MAHUQ-44]